MLGVPFLGEIPIDPKVVVGGDSGEPIVSLDPKSAAAEAFVSLARHVSETMVELEKTSISPGGHGHGHDHDHDHDHDHAHHH
jgi:ATP-binding protein involved in chromosome partitioning